MDPQGQLAPLAPVANTQLQGLLQPVANQPMNIIPNNPDFQPVMNTQHGVVYRVNLAGINNFGMGINGTHFGNLPGGMPAFQQNLLNQPKLEDNINVFVGYNAQNLLTARNNIPGAMHFNLAPNFATLANMLPQNPQLPPLNIAQPNMGFGNIMPIPNPYIAPQNNIDPNIVAPHLPNLYVPPRPISPQFVEIVEVDHNNVHRVDSPDRFDDTPANSSPYITDDETNWTDFERAIKTRRLLNKALAILHKADLIEKDEEILDICDSVEVKIKKISDRLDAMDVE